MELPARKICELCLHVVFLHVSNHIRKVAGHIICRTRPIKVSRNTNRTSLKISSEASKRPNTIRFDRN